MSFTDATKILKNWYENKKNEDRKTAADKEAERRKIGKGTGPIFETVDPCFGQVMDITNQKTCGDVHLT